MPETTVVDLPGIMRSKGWIKGAQLMEGWFRRPLNRDPSRGNPDTTTITMAWVLGFPRARIVYELILRDRIWVNQPAKLEIVKMLRRKGLLRLKATFGNFALPVSQIDKDYVQYRTVTSLFGSLDGLGAALGNFAFRVAIKGAVNEGPTGKLQIVVTDVGIYVRDSYDFVGSQSLGYWNKNDNSVGRTPLRGDEIRNSDFRDWQTKNGRGGDYLVFSDLKVTKLAKPDSFEVH